MRALPWVLAGVAVVGILLALGLTPWGALVLGLLPAGAELMRRARTRAVEETIAEQRGREYEAGARLAESDRVAEAEAIEARKAIPPPPQPGRVLSDAEIAEIVRRGRRRDPPS